MWLDSSGALIGRGFYGTRWRLVKDGTVLNLYVMPGGASCCSSPSGNKACVLTLHKNANVLSFHGQSISHETNNVLRNRLASLLQATHMLPKLCTLPGMTNDIVRCRGV